MAVRKQAPAHYLSMHKVWIKAFEHVERTGEPYWVDLPTETAAKQARWVLYSAVRQEREGRREADPKLARAIEELSVHWKAERPLSLVFQRKREEKLAEMLAAAIGEETVQQVERREEAESAERLQARLMGMQSAEAGETPTTVSSAIPHTPSKSPYPTRN